MKIRELGVERSKSGYKYTRIAHTSTCGIWEQKLGGRVVAYEVGYRKYRNPSLLFESERGYDKIESFWSDEDFGSKAWTYPPDKEKAMAYFNNLIGEEDGA